MSELEYQLVSHINQLRTIFVDIDVGKFARPSSSRITICSFLSLYCNHIAQWKRSSARIEIAFVVYQTYTEITKEHTKLQGGHAQSKIKESLIFESLIKKTIFGYIF